MRVAVAMSGGVDSSVAAALLQEEGHEVFGVTLQLWPKDMAAKDFDKHHGCCSLDAVEDARRVATRLGISYYVLNFENEFRCYRSHRDRCLDETYSAIGCWRWRPGFEQCQLARR